MSSKIEAGNRVRRTKGYPSEIGREGVVIEVHGTIAGDTLVSVRDDSGREWTAYTRQVEQSCKACDAWQYGNGLQCEEHGYEG